MQEILNRVKILLLQSWHIIVCNCTRFGLHYTNWGSQWAPLMKFFWIRHHCRSLSKYAACFFPFRFSRTKWVLSDVHTRYKLSVDYLFLRVIEIVIFQVATCYTSWSAGFIPHASLIMFLLVTLIITIWQISMFIYENMRSCVHS